MWRKKNRASLRTFLILTLSASFAIGLIGYLYASARIQASRHQYELSAQRDLQLSAYVLEHSLGSASKDLDYIFRLSRQHRLPDQPTANDMDLLASDIADYMDTRGSLGQVRWIGADGRERLRLERVDGRVRRVADDALQDKSGRYYFTATNRLPARTIYISPLNLNREHGHLEHPLTPVIRLALPVFDSGHHRHGILVVNFLGRKLIDGFAHATGTGHGRMMLANARGQWIEGPGLQDIALAILSRSHLLASIHPSLWKTMQSRSTGQVFRPDGLWSWQTIQPARYIAASWSKDAGSASPPQVLGKRIWYVVHHLPPQVLDSARRDILDNTILLMFALLLCALLVNYWAARKQMQIAQLNRDLRERADAAEAASEAKANFLANMSHEVRTPMNAILGLAYLLERSPLPADARGLVGKIRREGKSLLGIVNDVLDFSRIEAKRLTIEQVEFSLGNVLDGLSTVMASLAIDKEIDLIMMPPAGVDHLIGDALHLEQVLVNLVSNAIKFTEHGHVEVRIAPVGGTGTDGDGKVRLRFSVLDTGIGISRDQQERILQPFTQADDSTTRRYGGSGLGLAITRHLLELMGGELHVESTPGFGSTFWFELEFEAARGVAPSVPGTSHVRALIADDNPLARDALRITAASLGWQARVVEGGEEAVREARKGMVDVIVLDWKMPDMDGLAAARAIRQAGQGEGTPIIIMVTAHSRDELMAAAGQDTPDAVLSKPVTASSLYDTVVAAMDAGGVTVRIARPPPPESKRLLGLRLLVVDDSEINRDIARLIFAGEGAEVALAEHGQEAVDWLNGHPGAVDLVLMDIQMPVMDGYEATRIIRRTPGLRDLPIIALTAGAFESQRQAAREAGLDEFISKPFDVDLAVSLIARACGRPTGNPVQARTDAKTADLVAGTDASMPLPGLDPGRGMALWGDREVYFRYLRKFTRDHDEHTVDAMQAAAVDEAAGMAHKLAGSTGHLAMEETRTAASELEHALREGTASPGAFDRLRTALDTSLASARRLLGSTQDAPVGLAGAPSAPAAEPGAVAALLRNALDILRRDTPVGMEPVLAQLSTRVEPQRLQPLRRCMENFDFRGGEAAVHALARELGIAEEL